ncbi:hypothetical protein RIF25_03255 [Thermosynechococcaceae cyanobacterium BACA0444]|uniref:Uncharacterized protein n=1 Tax=Pseudocalidococcus azoricus BACA0444 TaxID=2918990 RepID=A0AAE4FPF8_9CYAN|nr:hypothetical protein [Pseudocalidococcus azoricus]MDS3859819.1 hypothetical protein [Pseudocalidococcus azoricus BACA0444]
MSRYDLSLYALRVMRKFIVILTIDEDPIFGQVIFTLFRVVKHDDFGKACQDIAQSLYQQVVHDDLDIAQVS